MTNNYILIFIKCVTVTRNSEAYYSAWTNELSNYLSGIVNQNDFRIITVDQAPNPTYLVVRPKTKVLYPGQTEKSTFVANDPSFTERLSQYQFNWQVGQGFSRIYPKYSKKFLEVNDEDKHLRFDFLIEKYLEFLQQFNTAYDDDLYLNLSYYHS